MISRNHLKFCDSPLHQAIDVRDRKCINRERGGWTERDILVLG